MQLFFSLEVIAKVFNKGIASLRSQKQMALLRTSRGAERRSNRNKFDFCNWLIVKKISSNQQKKRSKAPLFPSHVPPAEPEA
jgi:hypothetical protein